MQEIVLVPFSKFWHKEGVVERPSKADRERLQREVERQRRENDALREERDRLRRETEDLSANGIACSVKSSG
jgi:hypothetical protein